MGSALETTSTSASEARSYTDVGAGPLRFVRDRWMQYQALRRSVANVASEVDERLAGIEKLEKAIQDELGLALPGLRVLEIGHGPLPLTLAYLASRGAKVVGIDLNFVPQSLGPLPWFRVWRLNGFQQFAKGVGRELLGINAAMRNEFVRRLGLSGFPKLDLIQMDVSKLTFPDHSFDLVYSQVVFEHIPDPEAALRQILRVVKPGGAVHLTFCHNGWYNGLEDLRIICKAPDAPPPWSHLRPRYQHLVRQGAYVNKYRLKDWRALFAKLVPQARVIAPPIQDPALREEFARARAAGELTDYSDEELLADVLVAAWKA